MHALDIFSAFKDDKGRFKECLCADTKGMLSLYEASHFAFEGEEALDEARAFTTEQLKELKSCINPLLSITIDRALELPLRRRSPRLDVKWHIEQYENEGNMEIVLLHLAKHDYNMVQSLHNSELNRLAW